MSNELNILVGNEAKKSEDFVLKQQTLATSQGFKNVSKLWYDKTISYDEAVNKVSDARKNREDLMVKASNITPAINQDGRFIIKIGDGREVNLNEHAIKQFTAKMGSVWTAVDFLLNNPVKQNGDAKFQRDVKDNELLVSWFNNCIRRIDKDSEFLFRIYRNDSTSTNVDCRAVLTDRYSIVDNLWYLSILNEIIPDGRYSHWKDTDGDSVIGNIIIPDSIRSESDSDYGGMVSIKNCEIGKYGIKQMPSIFRAICMNGNIWGQTEGVTYKRKHMGINLDDLSDAIHQNINKQIPLMTSGVDLLLATKLWKTDAKIAWMFAQLTYDNNVKLNTKEIEQVLHEYQNHVVNTDMKRTCFGFIDALTRASQNMSVNVHEKVDIFAGSLLKENNWENFTRKAKSLTEKDVQLAFNVKA